MSDYFFFKERNYGKVNNDNYYLHTHNEYEIYMFIEGNSNFVVENKIYELEPGDMKQAMSDLEKYINSDDELDLLIQAALIHYQFETIHPFLDGNGRVGRLLITLFLMEKKRLNTPALYISYYLKNNRIEYYDRMSEVRKKQLRTMDKILSSCNQRILRRCS